MRVLSDGRVRRTEKEWRAILERYEASELSESAFCRRSKLPRSSFVKWKRRLASQPGPAPESKAEERGSSLELELPGGVVLRWKS